VIESIANLIAREADAVMQVWFMQVMQERELAAVKLTAEERCEHLPMRCGTCIPAALSAASGSRALFSMLRCSMGAAAPAGLYRSDDGGRGAHPAVSCFRRSSRISNGSISANWRTV